MFCVPWEFQPSIINQIFCHSSGDLNCTGVFTNKTNNLRSPQIVKIQVLTWNRHKYVTGLNIFLKDVQSLSIFLPRIAFKAEECTIFVMFFSKCRQLIDALSQNDISKCCSLSDYYLQRTYLSRVRQIVGSSPGRVKPKTIQLVFVVSPLSTHHLGERANTGWLGIKIMCRSGATCLPADCCFSELAQ